MTATTSPSMQERKRKTCNHQETDGAQNVQKRRKNGHSCKRALMDTRASRPTIRLARYIVRSASTNASVFCLIHNAKDALVCAVLWEITAQKTKAPQVRTAKPLPRTEALSLP